MVRYKVRRIILPFIPQGILTQCLLMIMYMMHVGQVPYSSSRKTQRVKGFQLLSLQASRIWNVGLLTSSNQQDSPPFLHLDLHPNAISSETPNEPPYLGFNYLWNGAWNPDCLSLAELPPTTKHLAYNSHSNICAVESPS